MNRDALRAHYQVQPEPFWSAASNARRDGYDVMQAAADYGWDAIEVWGEGGWDLGDWDRVVVYTRNHQGRWEYARYVRGEVNADGQVIGDGQVSVYSFPDQRTRDAIIDAEAFAGWAAAGQPWVAGYPDIDQMPPRFHGPHGPQRAAASPLLRAVMIPAAGRPYLYYTHPDLHDLQATLGGPLQPLPISADARAYHQQDADARGRPVNIAATSLWHTEEPAHSGAFLRGEVVILGRAGSEDADCPDRLIDALIPRGHGGERGNR